MFQLTPEFSSDFPVISQLAMFDDTRGIPHCHDVQGVESVSSKNLPVSTAAKQATGDRRQEPITEESL